MSKVDVSIIFPSIRLRHLKKNLDHIKAACPRHTWEAVIISPHSKPDWLNYSNVKWVRSFASPTACWQFGTLLCNSTYWLDTSDDALLQKDVVSDAIDLYESQNLNKYSIVSLELNEGTLDPETLEPLPNAQTHTLNPLFFYVKANPPFWKKCINPEWKLSLNYLIKLDSILEIGGFECGFQYINWSLHDMIFRLQSFGGQVISFPRRSLLVGHYLERDNDHWAVHDQQAEDKKVFDFIYDNLSSLKQREFIPFDNWKNYDHSIIWKRRFKDIEF